MFRCVYVWILRFYADSYLWLFRIYFRIHKNFALGFFRVVLLPFMHDLLQNECCSFFACFISAFCIVWAHAYCVIFCACICMFFCILSLYMYLPACLIFFNVFLLCLIMFCRKIALICCILFLQDFVDGMYYCKALVCCHNLLLAVVWTWMLATPKTFRLTQWGLHH